MKSDLGHHRQDAGDERDRITMSKYVDDALSELDIDKSVEEDGIDATLLKLMSIRMGGVIRNSRFLNCSEEEWEEEKARLREYRPLRKYRERELKREKRCSKA